MLSRLDFYFSSNPLAKPLILFSLTFVIIMVSCLLRIVVEVKPRSLFSFLSKDLFSRSREKACPMLCGKVGRTLPTQVQFQQSLRHKMLWKRF